LFTPEISQSINTFLAKYANGIAILASSSNPKQILKTLQDQANKIDSWTKKWKIKINTNKYVQITFTLKLSPQERPQLIMNNIPIPVRTKIKYLGIILNKRLTWDFHLKEKRKSANSRLNLLRSLHNSKIPLQNKPI